MWNFVQTNLRTPRELEKTQLSGLICVDIYVTVIENMCIWNVHKLKFNLGQPRHRKEHFYERNTHDQTNSYAVPLTVKNDQTWWVEFIKPLLNGFVEYWSGNYGIPLAVLTV